MTDRATTWFRRLWLGVPALGLCELVAQGYFAERPARIEQWRAARPNLVELRHAGELVVIAPSWAEPLARQAFGEQLMPLRDIARPDASGYARAIEISELGQRAGDLADWEEVSRARRGSFEFRVLHNPRFRPVRFDFVDELGPNRAEVVQGAVAHPCTWTDNAPVSAGGLAGPPAFPSRRFACEGAEASFVGVTVVDDENYRPRRCIWAPPQPSAALHIRYRSVSITKAVRGWATLPWLMSRDLRGNSVTLGVSIGGQRIGAFVHLDGEGWTGFEFSTGAHAGRTEDVEFEISSSSAQERHFCFQADLR